MSYDETLNDYDEFCKENWNGGNGNRRQFSKLDLGYIAHTINELNRNVLELVKELKKLNGKE